MTQNAHQMLKDKKIDFLATDAHNITFRSPAIPDTLSYLIKNCNNEYIERVLNINPSLLI